MKSKNSKLKTYISALLFFFLTFLQTGLGHIYMGSFKLGIILFSFSQLIIFLFDIGILSSSFPFTASLWALMPITNLVGLIHCLILIKRKHKRTIKFHNHWYICLITLIIYKFSYDLVVPRNTIIRTGIQSSMKPTKYEGETVLAHRIKEDLKRTDIVIFKLNDGREASKRVIGLPGDIIEIIDKDIYLNDQAVSKKILSDKNFPKPVSVNIKPENLEIIEYTIEGRSFSTVRDKSKNTETNYRREKIPPGHYFVMGDNFDYSMDSRSLGTISKDRIKFKVTYFFISLFPLSYKKAGLKL